MSEKTKTAIFAAGCFWGVEESFRSVHGVVETEVGYIGGDVSEPSYEQVCRGNTGHAEAVRVTYRPKADQPRAGDPQQTTYNTLLEIFWKAHDPTQMNRQGPDVGTQYRSAIFYETNEEKEIAEASKESAQKRYDKPIATVITKAGPFYRAEEYHQKYLAKRGQSACPI